MKTNTMKVKVSGMDCEFNPFTITCEFKLIPPTDSNHYGTGYYMIVKANGERYLIDVRYERTTNIEILADRWIKNYFGKNAHEITKI